MKPRPWRNDEIHISLYYDSEIYLYIHATKANQYIYNSKTNRYNYDSKTNRYNYDSKRINNRIIHTYTPAPKYSTLNNKENDEHLYQQNMILILLFLMAKDN